MVTIRKTSHRTDAVVDPVAQGFPLLDLPGQWAGVGGFATPVAEGRGNERKREEVEGEAVDEKKRESVTT